MEVFFNKPIHHCKTALPHSLISFDLANIVLCSMGLFSAESSFDSVLTHLAFVLYPRGLDFFQFLSILLQKRGV